MIRAYPSSVAADATSLLVYKGPANVTVAWALTGAGTLTPGPGHTDANGYAHAVYSPGTGSPIVSVTHGT